MGSWLRVWPAFKIQATPAEPIPLHEAEWHMGWHHPSWSPDVWEAPEMTPAPGRKPQEGMILGRSRGHAARPLQEDLPPWYQAGSWALGPSVGWSGRAPGPRVQRPDLQAPIGEEASTQESKPALALAGGVTLDKPTSYPEPPPPCLWSPRTGSRDSHLLVQLDPVFACPAQMLVIPTRTLDWERGGSLWAWPAVGLRTRTLLFCM